MPENEAPPKKQKANHSTNLANTEIDRRLAEAIKERTKLHAQVSRLYSAQQRLQTIEQEINSLVQLQARLSGMDNRLTLMPDASTGMPAAVFSGHAVDVPMGVGSIPAGPRQPKPTTANAGPEVRREGGFS